MPPGQRDSASCGPRGLVGLVPQLACSRQHHRAAAAAADSAARAQAAAAGPVVASGAAAAGHPHTAWQFACALTRLPTCATLRCFPSGASSCTSIAPRRCPTGTIKWRQRRNAPRRPNAHLPDSYAGNAPVRRPAYIPAVGKGRSRLVSLSTFPRMHAYRYLKEGRGRLRGGRGGGEVCCKLPRSQTPSELGRPGRTSGLGGEGVNAYAREVGGGIAPSEGRLHPEGFGRNGGAVGGAGSLPISCSRVRRLFIYSQHDALLSSLSRRVQPQGAGRCDPLTPGDGFLLDVAASLCTTAISAARRRCGLPYLPG